MARDEREFTKILDKLETKIEAVRLAHDRYFAGLERREPVDERLKLQKLVRDVTATHVTNTQLKFRLQMLVGRFNAFFRLWERTVMEIDAGTYRPDRFKADLRVGKGDEPKPAVPRANPAENGVRAVYDEFLALRKTTGESTDVPFDRFRALLDKQRPALAEKLGTPDVAFRVVVENGKTKLKGVAGK
jgi:hypothetical protein